jgi:hypothetical protein
MSQSPLNSLLVIPRGAPRPACGRVERVFNPDRKDHHWGKRKLKRDEQAFWPFASALDRRLRLDMFLPRDNDATSSRSQPLWLWVTVEPLNF